MAEFANPRPFAALALICLCATLPLKAGASPQTSAPKHRNDAPLRFEPPAAGSAQTTANSGYDACIEQPSPDGAAIDCHALAAPVHTARAKSQPKRHR